MKFNPFISAIWIGSASKNFALFFLVFSMTGCAIFGTSEEPRPEMENDATQNTAVEEPAVSEEIVLAEVPQPQTQEAVAIAEPIEPVVPEPIYLEAIGIAFLEPFETSEQSEAEEPEFIEATGYGFPSPSATSDIQKRITATEAAHYRAMANLAEKVSGITVRREASTENMAFAEEFVEISLTGNLSGVSEVESSYDTNSSIATVTLKMQNEKVPEAIAIPTLEQQRARAEAAARIHATALLREKISSSFVKYDLHIENMAVEHQSAHIQIEGLLQGALFSNARWTDETICEVTARLEIDFDEQKERSSDPIEKPDRSSDED